MKKITIEKLELLAKDYGMSFDDGLNPSIYNLRKGKPYGFEATEVDGDNLSGFCYFGDKRFMSDLMDVWNELSEPEIQKPLLTIEKAKELIGKRVKLSYCDVNRGEYTLIINEIKERESKQIGQTTEKFLLTTENGEQKDFIYEWQGIFRRGSGAERLFIEAIY